MAVALLSSTATKVHSRSRQTRRMVLRHQFQQPPSRRGLALLKLQLSHGVSKGRSKNASHCSHSSLPSFLVVKLQRFRQVGPIQLRLRLLLLVDFPNLIRRCILRHFTIPEDDVLLLLQRSAGHIIRYRVGVPGHMAVGYRLGKLGFGATNILHGPVYGVPLWSFIQACNETDHQLTISKYSHWQVELRSPAPQPR